MSERPALRTVGKAGEYLTRCGRFRLQRRQAGWTISPSVASGAAELLDGHRLRGQPFATRRDALDALAVALRIDDRESRWATLASVRQVRPGCYELLGARQGACTLLIVRCRWQGWRVQPAGVDEGSARPSAEQVWPLRELCRQMGLEDRTFDTLTAARRAAAYGFSRNSLP